MDRDSGALDSTQANSEPETDSNHPATAGMFGGSKGFARSVADLKETTKYSGQVNFLKESSSDWKYPILT